MITPHFGVKNIGEYSTNSPDDLFPGICQTQCNLTQFYFTCYVRSENVKIDLIRHDYTALWWKKTSENTREIPLTICSQNSFKLSVI